MPRLPTRDSLGPLPSARSGRAIARVDTTAVGEGAAALGQALAGVGAKLSARATEEAERNEQFEVQRRLIEFGAEEDKAYDEARGTVTGDGAGFADGTWSRFAQGASTLVDRARADGLSERALSSLDVRLLERGRRLENTARDQEMRFRDAHQTELLGTGLRRLQERVVADPLRLRQYLDEGNSLIDTSRLSPSARRAERERFRLETTRAAIDQRSAVARTLEEQEAIFRDVRTLQGAAGKGGAIPPSELMADDEAPAPAPGTAALTINPAPSNRRPVGAAPRQGAVEGIVLHHTSGTTLDSALSQNRIARTGYNYYVDRDGQAYRFAPDDQRMNHVMPAGHADRRPGAYPSLSSDNTIGIGVVARNDSDITDAQRETLARLTGQLASQHGIGNENIVGHGELQHTREESEGSFAREYREGRVRTSGARLPGDGPAEGFTFSDAAPYPDLSVAERQTVLNNLRTRFRASTIPLLRQGLEAIVNGEEPTTDRNGRTALDWARLTMTPLQRQTWERQWTRARTLRDATAPLYSMPIPDVGEYTANITDPAIRGPVTRRADRILELYDKDPARAVSGGDLAGTDRRPPVSIDPTTGDPGVVSITGNEDIRLPAHPAVRAAYGMIRENDGRVALSMGTDAAGNVVATVSPDAQAEAQHRRARENWRLLIDGRLAAQRQAGVAEDRLAPITREEARKLLNLPDSVSNVNIVAFKRLIQAAADRAHTWFGPYARMALETAVRYRSGLDEFQTGIAATAVRSMLDGEGMRRMGVDRQRSMWLDQGTVYPSREMEELTGSGPRPLYAPPAARGAGGWGAPQLSGPTDTRAIAPGATVAHPKPPPEEIEYLRQNPEIREVFDRDYGKGAAAFYLE